MNSLAMPGEIRLLWVYLSTTPLLWLTLTLIIYQVAGFLHRKAGRPPYLNPVLTSVSLLVVLLLVSGTDYHQYFAGAQFIHFLLGPATVSMAIPLYRELPRIKQALWPILITVFLGSLTAVGSAVGIAWALGGKSVVLLTLAPKSVTSPIAMGIAEKIGGIPTLAAVAVVLTGIFGAAFGDAILNRLNIRNEMARGLAIGVTSHGIGTAHAMQGNPTVGAFAALAMALNGLLTALMMPLLIALF